MEMAGESSGLWTRSHAASSAYKWNWDAERSIIKLDKIVTRWVRETNDRK